MAKQLGRFGRLAPLFFLAAALLAETHSASAQPASGAPEPTSTPSSASSSEVRAVWVASLAPGFRAPDEIAATVAALRRAHLNTLIAQIRRSGMVFFRSELEPRATTITGPDDWDPLEQLLREAHDTSDGEQRLDVYAWFNVYSLGDQKQLRGATPSPLAETHPEWYALKADGTTTTFLDPGVPAYQEHFAALVAECLDRHEVDGVNLDFIRYPEEDAGYSPIALARFRRLTGRADTPAPDDAAWNAFRRDQVSAMVRRTMVTMLDRRPEAMLSVCGIGFGGPPRDGQTFADSAPYRQVHQDWDGWARAGLVDIVTRMGYKRESLPKNAADFRGWADLSRDLSRAGGRPVTLGIGGYFNTPDEVAAQYREAHARGLGTSLFSFHRPQGDSEETGELGPRSPMWDRLGAEIYPTRAAPPRPVWRAGRGTIAGFARRADDTPLDTVPVALDAQGGAGPQFLATSDGNGFFAFLHLAPGEYRLTAPGTALDGQVVTVAPDMVAWANK